MTVIDSSEVVAPPHVRTQFSAFYDPHDPASALALHDAWAAQHTAAVDDVLTEQRRQESIARQIEGIRNGTMVAVPINQPSEPKREAEPERDGLKRVVWGKAP